MIKSGPVENHRGREDGVSVYPVFSRRSQGLSIGINLFLQKKVCNFDCPYCEVFADNIEAKNANNTTEFCTDKMKQALKDTIDRIANDNIAVKDICFSGNGEPTISADFPCAFAAAIEIRDALVPNAELVVISNGTGLLKKETFTLLQNTIRNNKNIKFWLKFDAGSEDWYKKINGSKIAYNDLVNAIKEFSKQSAFIIQTMHCTFNNESPSEKELNLWAKTICEIAANKNLLGVQIYGKARPAPNDPVCASLSAESLEHRADVLRAAFNAGGGSLNVPVAIYL
ncbi:MAG: radical SAM protein [Termitinemataceae bacterium]|nr:MAG: radical SAM protein [Termitinemataceae bacterium]